MLHGAVRRFIDKTMKLCYELKHYYRVKYALVCARKSFLKEPPKDGFEEYAKKVIDRAYFIVLNKIDELDGTNRKLLEEYRKSIGKYIKS